MNSKDPSDKKALAALERILADPNADAYTKITAANAILTRPRGF